MNARTYRKVVKKHYRGLRPQQIRRATRACLRELRRARRRGEIPTLEQSLAAVAHLVADAP